MSTIERRSPRPSSISWRQRMMIEPRPGQIGLRARRPAQDERRGREIGAGDDLEQLFGGDRRIVDIGEAAVDHFAQIVRRNVGRHADGDAAGAVDQQIGEARRQHLRLLPRAVVVVAEIDRVLVEIVEQAVGDLGQPRFGVAHRGRRIGVHRAEIALAVDQRQPHRPVLRHAGQRVVDRAVAVRVIIAHHVADDLGRLAIGPARRPCRLPARRTGCGGAPASARRARRAARG